MGNDPELVTVLKRIADALETIASAVDKEENEINVYVSGELATEESDEDEDEDDDEDDDDEE